MFYVIYKKKSGNQYRNEAGEFGSFNEAERFRNIDPCVSLEADEQWVGPKNDGEDE